MRIPTSQLDSLLSLQNSHGNLQTKNSELNEARKKDPALDRALYAADMARMQADISKADTLARKAARGETLSDEEQAFMEREAPEKLREVDKARQRAREITAQARQTKTPAEATQVLAQAATEMNASIKSGNPDYAQLLGEALRAAVKADDKAQGSGNRLSALSESMLAQHAMTTHRELYRVDTKA